MWAGLFDPVHAVILLIIVVLLVGPRRLPELGASLGKTIGMFKRAKGQMDHFVNDEKTPQG